MYLQIWSCSSHSQTSYIPIWFWFWFAVEIQSCFGMSNSVRCNIYLSWDSFSWYSGHLGGWFFLQSFIIFSNGVFLSFLNLVISVVFQWIHPRKVWGSLVTCGLFPGRFLNDFGLSWAWLDLLERKSEYLWSWVFLDKAARWLSQYPFRGACVNEVIDLSLPKLMSCLSCSSSPCSNCIVYVLSKPGPTFQARNKVKEGSNNFFALFNFWSCRKDLVLMHLTQKLIDIKLE